MLSVGAHEFIGYLVSALFISKVPRKKGYIFCTIITCLIGFVLIIPTVKYSKIAESIIASVLRLCTVFGYSLISMLLF